MAFVLSAEGASYVVREPLLSAAFSSALVGAVLVKQWHDGSAWRWLDNRFMQYLGERSYSFYLVHVGINWIIGAWVWGNGRGAWSAMAIALPVVFVVTLVCEQLLFRLVERPFLRLKDVGFARRYGCVWPHGGTGEMHAASGLLGECSRPAIGSLAMNPPA